MNLCAQELVPIAEILFGSSAVFGLIGLLLLLLLRDDDWTFSDVRREATLGSVAAALGLFSSYLALMNNNGSLDGQGDPSLWRVLGPLTVSSVLLLFVIFACTQMLLVRNLHVWLGHRDAGVPSELSVLADENRRIKDLMSRGHFALLSALAVAVVLIIWIGVEGRCEEATPSLTAPATQTDAGASE